MGVRAERFQGEAPALLRYQRRTQLDAATWLTCFLILLLCLPSRLVFAPLGAAGGPATIVACAGFGWWVLHHAQRPVPEVGHPRPVRWAILLFLVAFSISFVAAMTRPISADEMSTAMLGMVSVVAFAGVALLANDGLPTWSRFEGLVDRLVLLTTGVAVLALVQFVTHDSLVDRISIPGLSANAPLLGVGDRNGFPRPAGTATSPIEFGALLTTVLPLAIARARHRPGTPVVFRWLPPFLLGLAVVISISRSAVLCALLGMVVLAVGWPARARRMLAAGVVFTLSVVALVIPGMMGTLTRLFTGASEDNSVESRTDSYAIAAQFIDRAPVIGRGYSTFLPTYRIFDNQYLLLLVEVGAVGLITTLFLILTGARAGWRAGRLSPTPKRREYGQAVAAAILAGALGLALFDGFSFPVSTGVLFLVIGMAGGLLRLMRDGEAGHGG